MKNLRTYPLGVGAALVALSLAPVAGAQKSQATPTVVVGPSGNSVDSVSAIIQRDLNYGDRLISVDVSPALVASATLPNGFLNYALFAKFKARALIIPRADPGGVRIAYHDLTKHRFVQEAFFPIPEVPAIRSSVIRDSVSRIHAARDLAYRNQLVHLEFTRDSLQADVRGTPDRDRRKQAANAARRDSTLQFTIALHESVLRDARRNIVDRDSMIPLLVFRDSIARDSVANLHRMAVHAISDEVTKWITGQRGYAQSRVVYVQNGTLRVIDSDGANDRAITTSGSALSPQWHPSGNRVVYSDFNDNGTQIAQVDIWSRHVTLVRATKRGLNLTPAYTPNGRRIVYTNGGDGPSDLVVTGADSSVPAQRLSYATHETSSPTFSPDGRRMAYISPRVWQGRGTNARLTPQIFTMNADGTGEVQLTPSVAGVRSYRTSPDWSPDGTRVAYMQQGGDFQLWTIGVQDRQMRKLTTLGENEDPTWSPDSRHLAFTSNRSGVKEIWVLDTQSGRYRQLTHRGGGARLAAWSRIYELPLVAPVNRSVAVRGAQQN